MRRLATTVGAVGCCLLLCGAERILAQSIATSVQLPTFGVAVDGDGVLSVKEFAEADGKLHAQRMLAAQAALPRNLQAKAAVRKISLARLEQAVAAKLHRGEQPDAVMLHLAGLQRLQYVFCFPERGDIVLAGPAEGFCPDASGRMVGVGTGRPVLELRDLIVALRAYAPGKAPAAFVGCTIDPPAEGLVRLREFQKSIPHVIPEQQRGEVGKKIAAGVERSLGQAEVRVFGVAADTHFAQVLIEADYRMKRIGIGLEPPPLKITTFLGALAAPQQAALQRWWFTPNYECVKLAADRQAIELIGEGVQLLAEDKLIGPDGQLAPGAKPNKASAAFTASFTQNYPAIAAKSPVYAQLRTLIDLLVATAGMRRFDYFGRANWSLGVFADEKAFPVETVAAPKRAPCVANSLWKGNRLITPAGGGVSIRPVEAFAAGRPRSDEGGQLAARAKAIAPPAAADAWWWD